VVLTVRADFYHRCVEQPALAELLRTASYPLAAPQPWVLHEMILRPAERAGLVFEPGLDETVLNDTGVEPGALALMAFALAELYQGRQDGRLTRGAYERFKGVKGAIGQRAEETFLKLKADAQAALNPVFRDLVDVDEHGSATRRRAALRSVADPSAAATLVEAFTEARLLVQSRGEADEPTVEVAHEALLTNWPRLKDWIEVNAEQLRARRDLERAAREWREAGRPKWGGLPSGAILKRYRRVGEPSDLGREYRNACRRLDRWRRGVIGATVTVFAGIVVAAVLLHIHGLTMKHGTAMTLSKMKLYDFDEPEMVEIPAGEFWMGSRDDDPEAHASEKPRHRVRLAKPFKLGKFEVTFAQFEQFAYAEGWPLPVKPGWSKGQHPVINVSLEDAVAYAEWLSRKTGKRYRLPTEAEWEYAARAGTDTSRYWGGGPSEACGYANVADQSFRQKGYSGQIHDCEDSHAETARIGSFAPNAFGLHDMLGNVWEWTCSEAVIYKAEGKGAELRCLNNNHAGLRVFRGGSLSDGPTWVRSAFRGWYAPDNRFDVLGFRLAQDL
jgi:formylglycine-generating enzyme required for sulfatase activity